MSSDQIEDITSALNEMGVNIVESDEDSAEEDDGEEPVEEISADDTETKHVAEPKKQETVERTDDPVRMYLREMGAV